MKKLLILLLVPVGLCAMELYSEEEDDSVSIAINNLEQGTAPDDTTDELILYAIKEKIFKGGSEEEQQLQAMQVEDPERYEKMLGKLCVIKGSNKSPNKRINRTTIKEDFHDQILREIENYALTEQVKNLNAEVRDLQENLLEENREINSLLQKWHDEQSKNDCSD